MKNRPTEITGSSVKGHWDDLSALERVKMILNYPDHFLSLGLVTRNELNEVMQLSETETEYILDREDQPLFTRINLKSPIRLQALRDQLKTALRAVFL